MTAEQALSAANLAGWDVHTVPIDALPQTGTCPACNRAVGAQHTVKCPYLAAVSDRPDPEDRTVEPEHTTIAVPAPGMATVRTNPGTGQPEALGVVGTDYTPVQNEELAEWLTALVDVSGAVFETAGSLRGGQDVFLTMKLPEGIKIGGVDPVDIYLAGLNNHSGRRRLQVITTPIRVVCANTERAALHNRRSHYAIRHTQGIAGRMQEAREALQITWDYATGFQETADAMLGAKLSTQKFGNMIKKVWTDAGASEGKFDKPYAEWREPVKAQWDMLDDLFRNRETQENIRGTVWAGYQAIVEYLDWEIPVQGTETDDDASMIRASRTVDGTYDYLKDRAWSLASELVTS